MDLGQKIKKDIGIGLKIVSLHFFGDNEENILPVYPHFSEISKWSVWFCLL